MLTIGCLSNPYRYIQYLVTVYNPLLLFQGEFFVLQTDTKFLNYKAIWSLWKVNIGAVLVKGRAVRRWD